MAQVSEPRTSSRPAQHPGRLPQLRAARAARRHDSSHGRPRLRGAIKNFDRFALIVEHDGADHLIFKHAIATIRTAALGRQLLLIAPRLSPESRVCLSAPRASSLIVLDSVGIGELPDAGAVRRRGQRHARQHRPAACRCTSRRCARSGWRSSCRCRTRRCRRRRAAPSAAWPRRRRQGFGHRSLGDDGRSCSSGRSRRFPHGFPPERHRGVRAAASGADARQRRRVGHRDHRRLGAEHMRTGTPIVYTSADSVFQIAAHEDVIPDRRAVPHAARSPSSSSAEGLGVGRVIARPFVGEPGAFTRTANRHDYALDARWRRRCSIA